MLKFDLTRKYLVGFSDSGDGPVALRVAGRPPPARSSTAAWTVTALPLTALNPTTTTTHVITINTRADGFLADTPSVYVAVGYGGSW